MVVLACDRAAQTILGEALSSRSSSADGRCLTGHIPCFRIKADPSLRSKGDRLDSDDTSRASEIALCSALALGAAPDPDRSMLTNQVPMVRAPSAQMAATTSPRPLGRDARIGDLDPLHSVQSQRIFAAPEVIRGDFDRPRSLPVTSRLERSRMTDGPSDNAQVSSFAVERMLQSSE